MKTVSVSTADITIGARHRRLDEKKCEELAQSMGEIGLQQPISVWITGEGESIDVHLVAGLHRLEAARRLGWADIEAIEVEMDERQREIWELCENLIRADLSPAERTQHTARLVELRKQGAKRPEEAKPKVSVENFNENPKGGRPAGATPGSARDMANLTGQHEATVHRQTKRAASIDPDVMETITGTPMDKDVEMDALVGLDPDDQRQAVERVQTGASESLRDARLFIAGKSKEDEDRERRRDRLWKAWIACDESDREWLLDRWRGQQATP